MTPKGKKAKAKNAAVPQQSRIVVYRQGVQASALLELASERIEEVIILQAKGRLNGAAYMVGYSVELTLKAIIAQNRFLGFWPTDKMENKHRTHDFLLLLAESGLMYAFERECEANEQLDLNWNYLRSA